MNTKILFTVILSLILLVFINDNINYYYKSIFYWTKSEKVDNKIDIYGEPIFTSLEQSQFVLKDKKNKDVNITSIGDYIIDGKVMDYRLYKYSFSKCPFGDLPDGDLLISFGEVSKDKNFDSISTSVGYNGFNIKLKDSNLASNPGLDYLQKHITLNNLISANKNIRNAIYKIKTGDNVKIKGKLVNIKVESGSQFLSSNGPNDFGTKLLGNPGANEIIYVSEIIINDNLYK